MQQCLRALRAPGWEQRLQPLATHMVEKYLVRARGDAAAPLRHLDLQVLREALSRLLSQEWVEVVRSRCMLVTQVVRRMQERVS